MRCGKKDIQSRLLCGDRARCRISPPRFLAECRKKRLSQGSFVCAVFLVVCLL